MNIFLPDTPIYNTVVCYIITIIIIIVYKPKIIYIEGTNERKKFGFEDNETIFPFSFSILFFAIFYYLIFNYINEVHNELLNSS